MRSILFALCFVNLGHAAIRPFSLLWINHPTPNTIFQSKDIPNAIFVIESFFNACPPCNQNAPKVESLAEFYSNESRVHFLDVGVDRKKSEYQDWIRKHDPHHPVLMDSDQLVNLQLGTEGYPSSYVLDCHGVVVAHTLGVWDEEATYSIKSAIDALLKTQCE